MEGEQRVEMWDRGFLMSYIKAEQSRVSSPDLKNYFSVPGCIEGISMVRTNTCCSCWE